MTNIERAEEFANNGYALGCTKLPFEASKEGFLAGLEAARKDWEWGGKTVLTNIMEDLQRLIDELGTNEHTHECALVYCYIRRIREIRNTLTNRAVKRPIYAYVES